MRHSWAKFRFDIQNRGLIQHIQPFHMNDVAFHSEDFKEGEANGVWPVWGMGAENAQLVFSDWRFYPDKLGVELGAFVKMKDDKDALPWFYVADPFQVGLINDKSPFQV